MYSQISSEPPVLRAAPRPWSSERYQQGVQHLLHVVQELSLARDFATVQEIVRIAARRLTGCDGATFVLRDGPFCHYADEDAVGPLWKGKRFPLETCISGWAMLNRAQAVIPDIYADPRIPHDAYRPTCVKSLVMVPIRTREPIGAIGNYWAEHHQPCPGRRWQPRVDGLELRGPQRRGDTQTRGQVPVEVFHQVRRFLVAQRPQAGHHRARTRLEEGPREAQHTLTQIGRASCRERVL